MAPAEKGTHSFKVTLPEELLRHYEDKNKVLGSGGFAKVVSAQHLATNEKVAIKVMNKKYLEEKGDLHRAYNEIYALKHLSQQNICQLYEVYENKEFIYLVIEYCPGGELFDYIVTKKRLHEREARLLFRQILSAVAYIHKNGYAHRDLKPENMLLDENKNIKIIDFGLSAKPEHGLKSPLKTRAGSALYASPELISGEPYFGNATDVWSLGVVLYALLCGFLPFDHESTTELYRKIKKGDFIKPPWLSTRSIKLLEQMLEIDSKKRITVEKIMKHEWMMDDTKEPIPPPLPINKRDTLNYKAVQVIASYFELSLADAEAKISKFRYNHLTAFYFILCKMSQEKFQRFCQEYLHRDHFIGEPNSSRDKDDGLEIKYWTRDTPLSPYSSHGNNSNKSNNNNNNNTPRRNKTRSHTVDNYTNKKSSNREEKSRTKSLDCSALLENDKKCSQPSQQTPKKDKATNETKLKEIYTNTIDRFWPARTRRRASTLDPSLIQPENKSVQLKHVRRSRDNLDRIDEANSIHYKKDSTSTKDNNLQNTKRLAASCIDHLDSMDEKDNRDKSNNTKNNDKTTTPSLLDIPGNSSEKPKRTRSLIQLTQRLSGLFKQESKPRLAKGVYNVENTSSLPPYELKKQLINTLEFLVKSEKLTSYKNADDGYFFKCKMVEEKQITVFELEICIVPKMENVVGIRRKRLKGDAWKYKELVELVLNHTNL